MEFRWLIPLLIISTAIGVRRLIRAVRAQNARRAAEFEQRRRSRPTEPYAQGVYDAGMAVFEAARDGE